MRDGWKTLQFAFVVYVASVLIGGAVDVDAVESPQGDDEESKIVYVIRHGEKIDGDVEAGQLGYEDQCLSEKGWARAYNLRSLFGTNPIDGFRTPDAIYSANYNNPLSCKDRHGWYRTQQTVSVVARALGIEVDNTLGFFPVRAVAPVVLLFHKRETKNHLNASIPVNCTGVVDQSETDCLSHTHTSIPFTIARARIRVWMGATRNGSRPRWPAYLTTIGNPLLQDSPSFPNGR